jgi:hypothetical protein
MCHGMCPGCWRAGAKRTSSQVCESTTSCDIQSDHSINSCCNDVASRAHSSNSCSAAGREQDRARTSVTQRAAVGGGGWGMDEQWEMPEVLVGGGEIQASQINQKTQVHTELRHLWSQPYKDEYVFRELAILTHITCLLTYMRAPGLDLVAIPYCHSPLRPPMHTRPHGSTSKYVHKQISANNFTHNMYKKRSTNRTFLAIPMRERERAHDRCMSRLWHPTMRGTLKRTSRRSCRRRPRDGHWDANSPPPTGSDFLGCGRGKCKGCRR